MSSEETPLLSPPIKHEEIYKRFKPAKKRVIVALVSITGLLARTTFSSCIFEFFILLSSSLVFVSGTFVPSIPQIAKDLNTTSPIVRYGETSSE